MTRPLTERELWFRNRIGKHVFRAPFCDCPMCQEVGMNGLVICDANHAGYLAGLESESHAEGTPIKYFDSKSEVQEWLKQQNPG